MMCNSWCWGSLVTILMGKIITVDWFIQWKPSLVNEVSAGRLGYLFWLTILHSQPPFAVFSCHGSCQLRSTQPWWMVSLKRLWSMTVLAESHWWFAIDGHSGLERCLQVVGSIRAKTQKTEYSDQHGFELHRPSCKGTKLLFQLIKAIINQTRKSPVTPPHKVSHDRKCVTLLACTVECCSRLTTNISVKVLEGCFVTVTSRASVT